MIRKSLSWEAPERSMVCLRPTSWDSRQASSWSVRGYRLVGRRYVAAEGKVFEKAGNYTSGIAKDGWIFLKNDEESYAANRGTSYGLPDPLNDFVVYYDEAGAGTVYFFTSKELYHLNLTRDMLLRDSDMGASFAAYHHERVFLARGSKLLYSAPFAPTDFSEDSKDVGSISFEATAGDILALRSFKGYLFLFRKKEIIRLKADAYDGEFRAERIPYDGGEIYAGTVQDCGSFLGFLTERGVLALNGSSCRLIGAAEGDYVLKAITAGGPGKYYAAVTKGDASYIRVFTEGGAYFLDTPAEVLAGDSKGTYFGHGGRVYRLTEDPAGGTGEISFDVDLLYGGYARALEGVTVRGEGKFTVIAETENGSSECETDAGKRVGFARPLIGKRAHITLKSEGRAAVDSVTLLFRRIAT